MHGHIDMEWDTEITPRTYKRMDHPQQNDYDENITIFVTKNLLNSESGNETVKSVEVEKKIRDSIEYTSMTDSAR